MDKIERFRHYVCKSRGGALPYKPIRGVPFFRCMFQILGGCQGRRTGVGVTTVSNSLILGGWVTKVLKNGNKK